MLQKNTWVDAGVRENCETFDWKVSPTTWGNSSSPSGCWGAAWKEESLPDGFPLLVEESESLHQLVERSALDVVRSSRATNSKSGLILGKKHQWITIHQFHTFAKKRFVFKYSEGGKILSKRIRIALTVMTYKVQKWMVCIIKPFLQALKTKQPALNFPRQE